MFGPNKNHVKASNVLAVFKATIAIIFDGNMMEVDDLGLSMDYFDFRSRHVITLVVALDLSNFLSIFFYKFIIPIFGSKFVFEY